ncbi:hypothetical protein VPHD528_0029 [Vibrio phage D528]
MGLNIAPTQVKKFNLLPYQEPPDICWSIHPAP